MQHMALYSASIANGTVLLQVAAVADPIIASSGSGLLINAQLPYLWRCAAVGTNLTRVQLTSATLRDYAPFDVGPVNVGTAIQVPARVIDFTDNPIKFNGVEELDVFGVQSNAGAQRITAAVWFADGPVRPVTGRVFTMHWTASTTLAANAFTAITPVFDNGIPSGLFAIVGSRQISAGALFHRYIPRGGNPFRPGYFSAQAQSDYPYEGSRFTDYVPNLGEAMRFNNVTIPQIEIFSVSADTTEEGYIDMIQVGA